MNTAVYQAQAAVPACLDFAKWFAGCTLSPVLFCGSHNTNFACQGCSLVSRPEGLSPPIQDLSLSCTSCNFLSATSYRLLSMNSQNGNMSGVSYHTSLCNVSTSQSARGAGTT